MLILGIETSCDETSIALVRGGREVLSVAIASSVMKHAQIGGVVPEVAARDHVVKMIPTIEDALEKSGVIIEDIDAIAVTNGPGLVGSLLSGVLTAQVLSYVWKKELRTVHHIAGHIYANWLHDRDSQADTDLDVSFPILVMTASGGHNELVLMRGHGDFEIVGETLDDAAGEAFDKVGRMLGLGFPGGPAISKASAQGDASAYDLPRPMKDSGDFNFSFSGLKTAASSLVKDLGGIEVMSTQQVADVAACFEQAVVDVLCMKLLRAAEKYSVKEIHLSGGVSANGRLRDQLSSLADENSLVLRFPEKIIYCTDNAAMIAAAGFWAPREILASWKDAELSLSFHF